MSERGPEDAAPAAAPEEPVGTTLRMAREAAGLALEETARRLKFAPRQLDALERGEWSRLPGGAAVRGMIRQYARLLGLDADGLVARAGEGAPLEQLAQRFQQPIPFSAGTRRSNFAYLGLSIVLLVVVGAVAYQWRQERAQKSAPSFVSAQQAAGPQKAPAEAKHAAPPREAVRPAASSAQAASVAQPVEMAKSAARPAPAEAPQAPAPVAASSTPEEREPSGPGSRIVLRFEEESWVEIHSGSGKLLVSHLHEAGTERVISGLPPFSVVIGNAQHVKLTYNDRPVDLMPYVKVEVARFTLE